MTSPENLDRVIAALRDGPKTAAQIADALDISNPTAYEWLRALKADGRVAVARSKVQRGPGPRALCYLLTQ